jgi:hypothetical protein
MTLDAKERGTARERAWPARLGAWLGQRTLADLVLEAVRKVDGGELNPPVTSAVDSAFHPKAILAMLTYCHADDFHDLPEQQLVQRRPLPCGRTYIPPEAACLALDFASGVPPDTGCYLAADCFGRQFLSSEAADGARLN